jgi:photosystem II stability/assembly factor-like uncharacterized protein
MKNRTLPKYLVVLMLITFTPVGYNPVFAQPQSGEWKIQTEFGEMVLTVNSEGTHITKLTIAFSDYKCGSVTQGGTITQQTTPGWPITNNQFSFTTSIDPSGSIKFSVHGTFNQSGNEASGTWSINSYGTTCSGTWNHTLSNGDIPEAKWKSIGPYMGEINAMAMDNAHPDTVYAATPNGLYKTVDGAENWFLLDLPIEEMKTVTVSQSHSNKILCTTNYQVFKSADYGNSWETIWSDTMRVTCAVFNPENPGSIYIGTNEHVPIWNNGVPVGWTYTDGIYKSLDGGNSWEKISFFDGERIQRQEYVKYIIIDPTDTTKIYVGGKNDPIRVNGCMLVSHDNGRIWKNRKLEGTTSDQVYAMSCTPEGYENHRICAIAGSNLNRKFFISEDHGLTWRETPYSSNMNLSGNVRDNAIYISEDFPKWINMGGYYKYEENFGSILIFNIEDEKWYYYNKTPFYYPTSILFNNKVDYLGFRNDGVYKYMGNYTWLQKNKGFGNIQIYDLVTYPNDPEKMMVSAGSHLAKTTNSGIYWNLTKRSYKTLALNQQDTSNIFAGYGPSPYPNFTDPFYCYESNNGGTSWISHKLFTRGGVDGYSYTLWTGDILIFPGDPDRVLVGVDGGGGSGEGIYLSANGGSSWSRRFNTGVSAIAMDPANNHIVYAGTTNLGYVFRSTDQGSNWTRISPSGNDTFVTNVWDIEVDKNSRVFAATSSGLYTWEEGETWSLVPSFPTTNTSVIAIDNTTEEPVYYVGTSGQGVFVSSDGGSTWESFNDGLERKDITKLKISDSSPKYLYAGTSNGGVWVIQLEEKSTFFSTFQKPEISFTIFPNPNNGIIYFRLNSNPPERITIELINSLGQVIETRTIRYPSVNQTERFNVSHLSAGIYYVVVISDKFRNTRKIVIQ